MLIWSGDFFYQFPLDFLMRLSNEVNISGSTIEKVTSV